MSKLNVTDLGGTKREIEGEAGLSLMEILRDNDVDDLAAICGGCCSCCTCHVYVDGDWADKLPPREDDEASLLEDSPVYDAATSRLSCQVEFDDSMDGISLTVAPES